MTTQEKQDFLVRQLDTLEEAVENACRDGFYGDIPELVRMELEILDEIGCSSDKRRK